MWSVFQLLHINRELGFFSVYICWYVTHFIHDSYIQSFGISSVDCLSWQPLHSCIGWNVILWGGNHSCRHRPDLLSNSNNLFVARNKSLTQGEFGERSFEVLHRVTTSRNLLYFQSHGWLIDTWHFSNETCVFLRLRFIKRNNLTSGLKVIWVVFT